MVRIEKLNLKDKKIMLKKIFFTGVFCLVVSCFLNAQVQFRDLSFNDAVKEAKTANKIVLLVLESADCAQCNAVAIQGFSNPIFGRAVVNSCITVKVSATSEERKYIDSRYHITSSFGMLFVDGEGNYLHKYTASTTYYVTLMEQLNKALDKKDHPDTDFAKLQKEYDEGKRDFALLYALVAKKNELDMEHDSITEEMIEATPADSATSLSFLQFLAAQAPLIGSKAEQYMHKDNRNFNDAWFLMPVQKRVSINGRINFKSKNKAIAEKDKSYAEKVANYTAGTYTDRTQARRAHDKNMIDYYKGVQDTATYLIKTTLFYDQYLMNINVDSIKKVDSIRLREMFAAAQPNQNTIQSNGSGTVARATVQFNPYTQYYTNELNTAAWSVYTYTHDAAYNIKALAWAKRANEFYENPGAMDTYARLLYRTGNKEEAISWEEKAIKLNIIRKVPAITSAEYEEMLGKMRSGASAIDQY